MRDTPLNIPAPELDEGVITDGLCDSPEAQRNFDDAEKGRPPTDD